MKKIILIPVIFLFCNIAKTQEYKPFDFENGVWVNGYPYSNYFPDGKYEGAAYQFFCKGDTLIDSIKYFKLYLYGIIRPVMAKFDTIPVKYYCAIRNNDNKQVIVKFPTDTLPKVLYDFNLKIGDTILNGVFGLSKNEMPIVKRIDSILICGKYRKRYKTQGYYSPNLDSANLIEGIGMENFLFGDPSLKCFEFCYSGCYTEKNNNICSDCYLLLDTKVISDYYPEIKIFPNPAHSEIGLNSSIKINEIRILNLTGQLLYTYSQINSKTFTINIDFLKKGIYLIRLRLSNNEYNKKMLIKI